MKVKDHNLTAYDCDNKCYVYCSLCKNISYVCINKHLDAEKSGGQIPICTNFKEVEE